MSKPQKPYLKYPVRGDVLPPWMWDGKDWLFLGSPEQVAFEKLLIEETGSRLKGKSAGSLMIICPHCNCESFRLLAPATDGGKIGDRLPSGKHRITTAECITCGEQCYPFADYVRTEP